MPDIDETHIQIFESSKLEGLYVGDSLYKVFSTFSFCFLGSLHYISVAQIKALEIIPSFPTPTFNPSVILYLNSFKRPARHLHSWHPSQRHFDLLGLMQQLDSQVSASHLVAQISLSAQQPEPSSPA